MFIFFLSTFCLLLTTTSFDSPSSIDLSFKISPIRNDKCICNFACPRCPEVKGHTCICPECKYTLSCPFIPACPHQSCNCQPCPMCPPPVPCPPCLQPCNCPKLPNCACPKVLFLNYITQQDIIRLLKFQYFKTCQIR